MAIGDRIVRHWRTVAVLGAGLAGGAAAVAVATVPDSNGVIHACVAATVPDSGNYAGQTVPITVAPNVTVIDPTVGQTCTMGDESIAWNVTGPPGQTGPQGPPGSTSTVTGTSAVIYNVVAPTVRTDAPGIGTATIVGLARFPLLSETTVSSTAVGRGATARVYQLSLAKAVDSSSPRLHIAVATGRHFASATIVLYRVSGLRRGTVRRPGVILKLGEVTITSIQISSSQSGSSPLETLTLSFGKITKISQ